MSLIYKPISLITFLILSLSSFAQTQVGKAINGETAGDHSGSSVAISGDGNVVAIGSPDNGSSAIKAGHVRIFKNDGSWTQMGDAIEGVGAYNAAGYSVALNYEGNVVALGAIYHANAGTGHVLIYKFENDKWNKIGEIKAKVYQELFGHSVALSADGTILAVGAPGIFSISESSAVRVYKNENNSWKQIAEDIPGGRDEVGHSVSISHDGSIVAIGAPGADWGSGGQDKGSARVYELKNGKWEKIGSSIGGEAAFDYSAKSISLSGDGRSIAIGAHDNDGNGKSAGQVRVYKNESGTWKQVGSDIDGAAAYDEFGLAVSLNTFGNVLVVGAAENDGNGSNSGHARVFTLKNGKWTQLGKDIEGASSGDRFGFAVSVSGRGHRIAIGATNNRDNGSGSGHVRVYEFAQILDVKPLSEIAIQFYPNPTNGVIRIKSSKNLNGTINIKNSIGKVVLSQKVNQINETSLDLSAPSGIYFLEYNDLEGNAFVEKLVVL